MFRAVAYITKPRHTHLFVDLITTAEAAVILKVTAVRVRQLIRAEQLTSQKRGRDHLLERSEVERFDKNSRRPGGRPKKINA